MAKLNSTAFTPKEVEKGLHLKLIKHLLEESTELENSYNDIHITSDSYCIIIEWQQMSYEYDSGCGFKFIDEEHEVLKRVAFPDNHHEYLHDEEEKDALADWLKENPGWKQTQYGRWYNEEERKLEEKYIAGLKLYNTSSNLGATDTTNIEDNE